MKTKSGLQSRIRESYTQCKEDFAEAQRDVRSDPVHNTHLLLMWTSSGIWWWNLRSCFHCSAGAHNPNVLCCVTTSKSTNGGSQDVAQPLQMCFGGFRKQTALPHPSTTKSRNIYHLHPRFTLWAAKLHWAQQPETQHSSTIHGKLVDPSSSE